MENKLEKVKTGAAALLLLGTGAAGGDLYLQNRAYITESLKETSLAAVQVRQAAEQVNLAASEQRAFLKRQQDLFEDPKTQRSIGLALRTGDDLNLTVKKLNHTLDVFNDKTLAQVNDQVLPNISQLVLSSDQMVRTTAMVIAGNGNALKVMTEETTLTIAQVRRLLSDPKLPDLIADSDTLLQEAHLTAAEVRKAIPDLLAELQKIEENVGRGTGETADFIASFNKPDSKKSKIAKFLLSLVLSNARSLR